MYSVTYIYKYICRDGCNLRTLSVGIKGLHRIKRLQCISGGGRGGVNPPWTSRERNLQKIGVSSDSLIVYVHAATLVLVVRISCVFCVISVVERERGESEDSHCP